MEIHGKSIKVHKNPQTHQKKPSKFMKIHKVHKILVQIALEMSDRLLRRRWVHYCKSDTGGIRRLI